MGPYDNVKAVLHKVLDVYTINVSPPFKETQISVKLHSITLNKFYLNLYFGVIVSTAYLGKYTKHMNQPGNKKKQKKQG